MKGQCPGAAQQAAGEQHSQDAGKYPLAARDGVSRPLPEQEYQSCQQDHQCHGQQNDVSGGEIIGQGIDTSGEHRHIRHIEGRHAVQKDEAVDGASHQPHR